MENQNYRDELEQFLHDEVKQHRIYPSDHVWKNIRTELHGNHSWPALSFFALFIITALTLSTLLINHPARFAAHTLLVNGQMKNNLAASADHTTGSVQENYFTQMASGHVTAATLEELASRKTATLLQPETVPTVGYDAVATAATEKTMTTITAKTTNLKPAASLIASAQNNKARSSGTASFTAPTDSRPDVDTANSLAASEKTAPATTTETTMPPVTENTHKAAAYAYNPPVVINQKRNSKVGIQFYLTPSTSYRKLTDEKLKEIIQPASTAVNTPLSQNNSSDVNQVVRHKPAIGLEFGFAVLYNMSNHLKFKTGVQMNIRQYYIETFQSPTSDVATISLINYRGIENINLYSPYHNNSGLSATQLDNKLYQVAVPLGLQWEILDGKHFGVNTEASVQPTFTLNKSVYLLSTDLKHYADGGSLLRKWNVNTGVGINLTYKTRGATIQLGPQIRYQHLPTYSNLYPIKEYLLDYGLRLGITKQLSK